MQLIKRYNTFLAAWEVGFYRDTRFIVLDIVPALDTVQALYGTAA